MGEITIQRGAGVTQTITLSGDVTGSGTSAITTAIASGVVVNDDINASAAIVDTKLATIATAGKVSNSATTATNANTASAIVARDASGNFTAGTITAALTGTASGNLVSGGALGTPSSGTLTNCSGTAASLTAGNVTTNANLTGHVTSTGNAAVLGSFTLAQLNTAISDANVGITQGTHQVTTSGTSFAYTGIPAGTKKIVISFSGVSLSGTNDLLVQIGDAGGIETTSYVSASSTASASSSSTAGFIVRVVAGTNVAYGTMVLTLVDAAAFEWVSSHSVRVAATATSAGGGNKALSAELTQLLILASGADTFDAGKVNIQYS